MDRRGSGRFPGRRVLAWASAVGVPILVGWSLPGAAGAGLVGATGTPSTALPPPVQEVVDSISPTTTSSSSTTTTTSSTTTTTASSTTTTTTVPPPCDGTRKRGKTDVGVTAKRIRLGAVTVESGPAASFLRGETTALRAVVERVNAAGGVCDRTIELDLRESGWDDAAGFSEIQDLNTRVLALVVNPDSRGLRAASESGFLAQERLPVVGTDGLFGYQFDDPFIWPVGPSPDTTMRVVADAQHAAGLRHPSAVYEASYGLGREGADAYHDHWERLTGSGVPGHSAASGCSQRSCGIPVGLPTYLQQASALANACGQEPACDAGVVALDPPTALNWFRSGGRFGGISDPREGAGAAGPLLFSRSFAQECGTECSGLRVWTAFLPPVAPFAEHPAVARYVDDMRAVSESVDVVDQQAMAAYVGAQLAVDALLRASGMPGGITRTNLAHALDTTSGWDSGLTVGPLSWSPGDHRAASTLHAFDIVTMAGMPGFRHVPGSARADPGAT